MSASDISPLRLADSPITNRTNTPRTPKDISPNVPKFLLPFDMLKRKLKSALQLNLAQPSETPRASDSPRASLESPPSSSRSSSPASSTASSRSSSSGSTPRYSPKSQVKKSSNSENPYFEKPISAVSSPPKSPK